METSNTEERNRRKKTNLKWPSLPTPPPNPHFPSWSHHCSESGVYFSRYFSIWDLPCRYRRIYA